MVVYVYESSHRDDSTPGHRYVATTNPIFSNLYTLVYRGSVTITGHLRVARRYGIISQSLRDLGIAAVLGESSPVFGK